MKDFMAAIDAAPADADYVIASNGYTDGRARWVSLWMRPGRNARGESYGGVIATADPQGRAILIQGLDEGASCFDADRGQFVVGDVEQLDRFKDTPPRSAYAEMQALRRGMQSIL